MKLRQRLILTAACLMAIPQTTALAEQANPSMWGYSGLLNVPTADTLGGRRFYTGLRYFPLNSGLSGTAAVNLFDDFEAALVFGIPPANGFSALAASLKYRIMDQHKGQPISLAIGASLLGLDTRNQVSDIPGNQLYLMISRGVDWNDARLFNLHGGFMGGLGSARLVAGFDIPVGDVIRFEAEYLGSVNFDRQVLNFGAVVTPHPDVSIELGLIQQPSTNFADRDITLGVTYHGDWGKLLGQPEGNPPTSATPNPTATPTPAPSVSPANTRGNARVRILDKERIIALEGTEVTLKQPETGLSFSANTDINGEVFLPGIPTGKYQVKVVKEGWREETRMVSIQPELNTFLEIPISGIAGSIYGTLSGVQNNTDTLIELLDAAGKVVKRQTLEGLSYGMEAIPPGQYTLLVKQEGIERSRLNIQVKGDTRSQYDIRVVGETPQASPSPTPTLNSTPPSQPPVESPSPEATQVPVPTGQNAEIKGTLKNKAGEPLSSIRLELKNEELLVITLTKSDGTYAFRDIPKGVYRLGISGEGYTSRAFQITINKPEVLQHDFTLERTP
jgi:hypothetical protein